MGAREPEHVANGVLFRVLRTLPRSDDLQARTFRAVLYRSLKNAVIDEHRALKSRPITLPLDDDEFFGMAESAWPQEQAFSAVDDRDYVKQMLQSLKAEHRDVLRFRFLEDLSIEETARRLGRSNNATRQLQHRAIRTLRATMVAVLVLVAWLLAPAKLGLLQTIGPTSQAESVVENQMVDVPDVVAHDVQDAPGGRQPLERSTSGVPVGPVRIRHIETGRYLVAASSGGPSLASLEDPVPSWTITDVGGLHTIDSLVYDGLLLADQSLAVQAYADVAGSVPGLPSQTEASSFLIRSPSTGQYLTAVLDQPTMTTTPDPSSLWTIEAAPVGHGGNGPTERRQ